ncbi:hypothetical protein E2C01_073127 [Portunus trituberculatus]|uniref:Uncharacterized protein n=1 Tax=Portunus trituberculatus TaxID=210409 RepID=A0A5B7ID76_PORTR|nr:hypothetical protein [Portunus trituberculatus]
MNFPTKLAVNSLNVSLCVSQLKGAVTACPLKTTPPFTQNYMHILYTHPSLEIRKRDHKCPPRSAFQLLVLTKNVFFINFCNIHSLRSNFQSVEHHLSSAKPHLLFLTETRI